MLARDIMTRDVLVVRPDTSVAEIAKLLVSHHISAVPVVGDGNALVGIVSEGDLMRRPETGSGKRRSWWLELLADTDTLAQEYAKSHARKARDVMSKHVVAVSEDTSVGEIADLLERHGIKRVPVVTNGKLVGLVSRADIVRAFAERVAPAAPSSAASDDKTIRAKLMEQVEAQPWAETAFINVVVKDGVVSLNGLVGSNDQAKALRVLAENVPGVKSVEDNTRPRSAAMFAD
ncbi:MAG TPA: CBS domain-containing protein [Alphaproteobacteria bacterium]|nr:CBS domain-containing protein [Alphaproteobacteria bacterium]